MMAIIWMAIVTTCMIEVTIRTWKHSKVRWFKIFSLITTVAMACWTIYNLINHFIDK